MNRQPSTPIVLAWCLAFAAMSTAWCWSTAWNIGPTFDEPLYLRTGLKCWSQRDHEPLLAWGTMPLPAELQSGPLFLFDAVSPLGDLHKDSVGWVPVARMTSIVFWWLLLWATYRLAAIYAGRWAGCLAVALVACEPILLGHAALAATDLPFAACFVQLLAVFRGRRDRTGWAGRLLAPACWVALTFLAKASAFAFVPIGLTAIEAERRVAEGWRPSSPDAWRTLRASALDLLIVGVLGIEMLFMVCFGAWDAISFQIGHNGRSTPTHLFSAVSTTGFWDYFAATLVIKLGLPVLLLGAAMLVLAPRSLANGATAAGLCLLAATPLFRVQLGVRFVLAIGVLFIIGGAVALVRWHAHGGKVRRVFAATGAGCLILWSLATAWSVWPNGMCYVNPLFGGPDGGFRILSESNCDWGQGVPELERWRKEHADAPLSLWYFGADPAGRADPFDSVDLRDVVDADQVRALVAGHYLAVSSTYLFTYYPSNAASAYLRSLRPFAITSTYLIYDFRDAEPALLLH